MLKHAGNPLSKVLFWCDLIVKIVFCMYSVLLPEVSFMMQYQMTSYLEIVLFCRILSSQCPLLQTLGNKLPYEIAVGQNGRIWVKGRSVKETIAISNAISSAEHMDNSQIKIVIRRLVEALSVF